MEKIVAAFVVWNIIVFLLYGIDKYKAVKNKWRIKEAYLILCAVFMGGAGAVLGMHVFRHKINNQKFRICVPGSFFLNIVVVIICTMIWN